jgi:hypothetical protein
MQKEKVFALDIPAGLSDLGAQIHATSQGLIQQLNHVQANFRRQIDVRGMEDLGANVSAHSLSLRLSAVLQQIN